MCVKGAALVSVACQVVADGEDIQLEISPDISTREEDYTSREHGVCGRGGKERR